MHAALELRFIQCHHNGAKFNTTINPLITITGMCVYAMIHKTEEKLENRKRTV